MGTWGKEGISDKDGDTMALEACLKDSVHSLDKA